MQLEFAALLKATVDVNVRSTPHGVLGDIHSYRSAKDPGAFNNYDCPPGALVIDNVSQYVAQPLRAAIAAPQRRAFVYMMPLCVVAQASGESIAGGVESARLKIRIHIAYSICTMSSFDVQQGRVSALNAPLTDSVRQRAHGGNALQADVARAFAD